MAQTAGKINGTDFLLYVNDTAIGGTTSHTLDLGMDTRETSNKDDNGWRTLKEGMRNWSASGDGFFAFDATYGYNDLFALVTNRTYVKVRLSTDTAGNTFFQGYGYLTNLSADTPNEDNTTYSFTFEGSGPLTKYTGT